MRQCTQHVSALVLSILVLSSSLSRADNWPRFRGPNGTGISPDKNIPTQFSDKDGVLWKTPLPGTGNSSPIVWENNLFLQAAPSKEVRQLLCINTADGKTVWAQSLPGSAAKVHAKSSLASSTPASDGERVYTLFWDGQDVSLVAYDFQGKLLWKQGLGSFTSQHGFGTSPMIVDGKVVVNNDQDGIANLLAFDAVTGKEAWHVARPAFRTCYSTPFIHEENGEKELIVASTAGFTGYNPHSGSENWKWTWTFDKMPLRTVGSPIFSQGMIFCGSGDGAGDRHMVAVRREGKGDVSKTNLVWEKKKTLPYVPSMLAWGDHIYYVNDRGEAGCIVAKTGKEVWSERLGKPICSSPVLIDGKIYAASEDGEVYVFAAAPEYKLIAKNNMGEGIMASPAVANGRLYIRGKTQLFCIGKGEAK